MTRFNLVSLKYKGSVDVKGDPLSPHLFPYATLEFKSYLSVPIVIMRAGVTLHQREVFKQDARLDHQ